MNPSRWRAWIVCVIAVVWGLWVCLHTYTRAVAWHAPLADFPIASLPFAPAALSRAVRASAGALLVWIAAWQIGRLLLSRFDDRFAGLLERAQFTLGVGAVALSLVFMIAAASGAYTRAGVFVILIAAILLRPRAVLRDLRAGLREVSDRARSSEPTIPFLAFVICAALGVAFAAIAALAPEVEYDALWYHLWLPSQWLQNGRLVDFVSEYISLYPGGWELLNGAAMVVGGSVAAKLLHFAGMLLMAGAAVLLGRLIAPGVSQSAIVALSICVPTVLWEAATAYVDLALAWFTTLAAVAVWRLYETGDRRWLVVGSAVVGGALTTKHLGLIALVPLGAGVVAAELQRRKLPAAVAAGALFVALALAAALPWYARALAASGNPVFPELYGVFGARPDTRWSEGTEQALHGFKDRFGMGRNVHALATLPWNLTTHGARFGGSIGPLFLILVPFAALTPKRNRRRIAVTALGAATYVAVWASPLGSFQLRFLLPLVPCGAVLAAAGVGELATRARQIRAELALLPAAATCLLLVFNLPPFMDWQEKDRKGWEGWLTHVPGPLPLAVVIGAESENGYLARRVPTFRAWRALDGAPPGSRVLTFSGGDHLYSRRARVPADSTLAHAATWGATSGHEAAMLDALRRLGITHVLFEMSPSALNSVRNLAITSDHSRACCLVPFYSDERAVVYEVHYPPVDGVPFTADPLSDRAPMTRAE